MRVLLIAVFLLFVLGLGAVLFLPGFVDVADYRDKISKNIEEIAGSKVKIDGAVSFNIFPTPRIEIEKMSLANHPEAKHPEFLTIEKLEGEISFLSLIQGDVKMTNLVLTTPVLNFDTLKTGEKAWVQNAGQEQANVFKRVATGVHFDHVKVQDGIIRYYNGQRDTEEELNNISSEIISESIKGPFSLKGISSYKDNDVQFNIISGKATSDGSAPVRVELLSDKAAVKADFAGVLTVFEGGDETFEAQGEMNIQAQDINRVESLSFIGGMEASLVKAKAFLTASNKEISFTNISGEIGKTPFTGKIETKIQENGQFETNTELKVSELNFVGIQAKSIKDNKDILSKIPLGYIQLDLARANFEDAIIENVLFNATKTEQSLSVTTLQAILPGQVALNANGSLSNEETSFTVNLIINKPQEFFKWANFEFLPNPEFVQNDKVNLEFSYANDKEKRHYTGFEWSQNGKGFGGEYFENKATTPVSKILEVTGTYIDLDALGYSKIIANSNKEMSWIKEYDWAFEVSSDEVKYQDQNLKKFSLILNNKKSEVNLGAFYVEGLYGSTINAKGHYDAESNSKPFDFLVNVQSTDLKSLLENTPLDIDFPSYDYGQSDLSISYARKEEKKNLAVSGTTLGAKWQMDGIVNDLSFKGDYNLTIRTASDDLAAFFSHFSKDTDMSPLKDKKGDFYTNLSKAGDTIKFANLKGKADETPFNGDIHLIDKKLTINLDVDSLHLDKHKTYLSFAKGMLDKNDMNGIVDLKTKKATYKTQNFNTVSVGADFDKSKITLNKSSFGWMGETHQATGTVDWNGDYNFDITTDGFDLNSFKSALPFNGANASAKTKLSGNEDTFNGESEVKIKNGSLTKMDLTSLSVGLGAGASVDTLLTNSFSKGTTNFSLATANIDFDKDGIVVKSFEVAGDFGKIIGSEGAYNFGDKAYAVDMEVNLVSPEDVPAFDVNYGSASVTFDADELKSYAEKRKSIPASAPALEVDNTPADVAPAANDDIGGILQRLETDKAPVEPTPIPPQNQLQENDLQEPIQ